MASLADYDIIIAAQVLGIHRHASIQNVLWIRAVGDPATVDETRSVAVPQISYLILKIVQDNFFHFNTQNLLPIVQQLLTIGAKEGIESKVGKTKPTGIASLG